MPTWDPSGALVVLVTQSCLTLCNPMGCSPPGSSVHGISQARILEWVAISFSSQQPFCSYTSPLLSLAPGTVSAFPKTLDTYLDTFLFPICSWGEGILQGRDTIMVMRIMRLGTQKMLEYISPSSIYFSPLDIQSSCNWFLSKQLYWDSIYTPYNSLSMQLNDF